MNWEKILKFTRDNKALLAILLIFGAATIYYLYLGFFMRPLADDFCTVGDMRNNGFLNDLGGVWFTYSFRYSSGILARLLAVFNPLIFQLQVLLFFLTTFVAFNSLSLNFFKKKKMVFFIIAIIFLVFFATLVSLTPNKFQSIYWFAAAVVFTWSIPFIFLGYNFFVKWLRSNNKKQSIIFGFLSAVTLLYAFGFSEVFALAMLPLSGMVLLFGWVNNRAKIREYSLPLLINLSSIAAIFLSPARLKRQSSIANDLGITYHPSIERLIMTSIRGVKEYIFSYLLNGFKIIVILVVILSLVFIIKKVLELKIVNIGKVSKAQLLFFIMTYPITIFFSVLAPYYVWGVLGPDRLLVVQTFVTIVYVFAFSFLIVLSWQDIAGLFALKDKAKTVILLVIIALASFTIGAFKTKIITKTESAIQDVFRLPAYISNEYTEMATISNNFDKTKRIIENKRKAGEQTITIQPIGLNKKVGDFTSNEKHFDYWINICGAEYFQVKKIIIPQN